MNQNEMILSDLERGQKITQLDAYSQYNCTRLAARIKDLRNAGHNIKKNMIPTKTNKQIAQYYMDKEG